jgi:phosphatidylglycerol---prolipoprotein diacylglyceryl transferase
MHPVLLKIGPITIYSYGFLIAIGFLVAVSVFKRLSAREKIDLDLITDLSFWGLLVGFLGARILFILTRLDSFLAHPLDVVKVWEGGLVFFGGPGATIPYMVYYIRKHKMPLWKTLDIFAPGLAIAHAFGRFGCFAAGCCYGKPTDSVFGVRFFSELVATELHGIPLHPTQLYEAFSLLLLFGWLLWVYKIKKFDGQVALSYLIAYPVIRSVIEVFRGDTIRGFVIEDVLSTSQFISGLVFLGAVIVLRVRLKSVNGSTKRSPGK